MTTLKPTTDDVGLAIRDALDLVKDFAIEIAAWDDDHPEDDRAAYIDHVDDSDPSNLRVVTAGAIFVIRIVREG